MKTVPVFECSICGNQGSRQEVQQCESQGILVPTFTLGQQVNFVIAHGSGTGGYSHSKHRGCVTNLVIQKSLGTDKRHKSPSFSYEIKAQDGKIIYVPQGNMVGAHGTNNQVKSWGEFSLFVKNMFPSHLVCRELYAVD